MTLPLMDKNKYLVGVQYGWGPRWLVGMPTDDLTRLREVATAQAVRHYSNWKGNNKRGAKPRIVILKVEEVFDGEGL